MHLLYQPDMTVVEICSGTAPGSRVAAFLGLNSLSFDSRDDQTTTATSLIAEFLANDKYQKIVCIYF
jgi:mitochondrial fission protein ELM1